MWTESKEATVTLGDREVKIAVVNGLRCADEVMRKIQSGELYYDFVEVMACKRGLHHRRRAASADWAAHQEGKA